MIGTTLLIEDILSALNKVAWQQSVKEIFSSKSFSDSDDIRAKGNAFTSTKSINKFVSIQELIESTLTHS